MTRREALKVLGAGAASVAWPRGVAADGQAPTTPNVLFVFSDQQQNRAWELNNSLIETPRLMQLAAQGTVVQNCIAQTPICTPMRAMMMSGQYPRTTGAVENDKILLGNGARLSEVTASLGYRNAYMGKWHLSGSRADPMRHNQIVLAPYRHAFSELWKGREATHNNRPPAVAWYDENDVEVSLHKYRNFQEADEIVAFLDDHTANHAADPFFAVWSMAGPHNPYNQYDPNQLSPSFADYRALLNDPANLPPNHDPAGPVSLDDIAGYYAMCSGLDAGLGQVLDHLDAKGLSDNTIVVYTSDHGDMLGAFGLRLKQKPWQEANNIPFIVRYPGVVPAGVVSDMLLGCLDFMPTLLGLMGQSAAIPAGIEGWDLSGALCGQPGAVQRENLWIGVTSLRGQAAAQPAAVYTGVRTKRHTYASFQRDETTIQQGVYGANNGYVLYDNINDPWQLDNRVDQIGSAALQADLYDQLVVLNVEAHETFILPSRPTTSAVAVESNWTTLCQ